MSSATVGIGIIGAGRIGKVHAENLALRISGAHIVAITDLQPDAAQTLAKHCGIPRTVPHAEEVLADRNVDAVLICSPTDTHTDLIVQAAASGKHVFCEKPIAHTLQEIDRALDAVRAAGVQLQIGFNRRFDANFARVRQAVTRGEIGHPSRLHIVSRDPAPPSMAYIRNSGGIFLDMTIHDFDMARFLMGEEPEEIYATGGVMTDPEIAAADDLDSALIVLRFKSGALGVIDNARRASYGYDQRVEVFGSLGRIATDNCYANQAVISDAESVRRDLPLNFFMDRYTESFVEEIRAFIAAVQKGGPASVTGSDGRAAVMMAIAARQSYEKQKPVCPQSMNQQEIRC